MRKQHLYHFIAALILILVSRVPCRAETGEVNSGVLSQSGASRVSVLPGAVQGEVYPCSYGAVAVCEGRMITAFSRDGTLLWQRAASARPKPFLAVGPSDLLCVVTGSSTVQLLNPTGLQLWKADAGSAVSEAPQFGWDGRIFARGRTTLCCWGLGGIQKWRLTLTEQDDSVPLVQLDDGSLLSFLTKTDGGNSVAVHVSPFGEILAEVTFSGTVTATHSCGSGAILVFADGSMGLCSSREGELSSGWRISQGGTVRKLLSDPESDRALIVTGNGNALVTEIDTRTGAVTGSYGTALRAESLTYAALTSYGLVLADRKLAVCLSDDGSEVYQADFSGIPDISTVFATDSGYVVLCKADWSVASYRMKQSVASEQSSYRERAVRQYDQFYRPYSVLTARAGYAEELVTLLSAGGYGIAEASWLPYLSDEMAQIDSAWTDVPSLRTGSELPWLRTNLSYTETVLTLASLTGTALYQRTTARLLSSVTDPQLLLCLTRTVQGCAYDPDGTLLSALAQTLRSNPNPRNTTLLKALCDATAAICRFMGRPAYFRQGQEMLSSLMLPSYDRKVRDYAVQTLRGLAELSP